MGRDAADYDFDPSVPDDECDVAGDDEWEMSCGLRRDGLCSQAGTEHCDFECPNRNSDLFVGSAAWRAKHEKIRKG